MKKMMLVLILAATSCGTERDEIRKDFLNRLDEFNQLKESVDKFYLRKSYSPSRNQIVINDCNLQPRINKNDFCADNRILSKMRILNIKEILAERMECDSNKQKFDKISFFSERRLLQSSVCYLYEACGETISYETDSYYQKSISPNWSFIIDKSFP